MVIFKLIIVLDTDLDGPNSLNPMIEKVASDKKNKMKTLKMSGKVLRMFRIARRIFQQ